MAQKRDPYSELRRIARRRSQRGYFTSAQAVSVDISRMTLKRLVDRGLVERCASGVYRFRVAAEPTWKDRLAVELLASDGVASGLSSVALYDLVDPPARQSVMVPHSRTAPAGRHWTRNLLPSECVVVDGLRTLGPTRAVLDSAHLLPPTKAIAMIETAIVRGLVKPETLRRRAIELKHYKRPGCAVTLRILDDLHPELARSRNEWEALVVRRAREAGLPPPRLEFEILVDGRRYIADAAWPDPLVLFEFDGRDPHMRKAVHDYDAVRRNDLAAAGWLRFTITAGALQRGDDRVFRQVARAIATG